VSAPEDALSLDVRRDLERVDQVMTRIVTDPATAEEFIRDPSGVLTRLGLHPRTTRETHDRLNRIFYAVLTNTELMGVVLDHYSSFETPTDDDAAVLREALGRGEIENPIELDLRAAEYAFQDPAFLRRVYGLVLRDLNNRRLLDNTYSTEQIDDYVERMVDAIQARRGLREDPAIEDWDEYYGVNKSYGVARAAEVATFVTVVTPVEVVTPVTVVSPVFVVVPVGGLETEPAVVEAAIRGDARAARTLATLGAVLRLAGEMYVHANNFERS
jgi:hypothetical protein